jgi:hypothetical protein
MPIFKPEALDTWYEQWLEKGYEGQIIRIDGPYEQKRTKLLLKRKEFVDSEFVVLDILEGVGNASGGAKVAWLQLDKALATAPNNLSVLQVKMDVQVAKQDLKGAEITISRIIVRADGPGGRGDEDSD